MVAAGPARRFSRLLLQPRDFPASVAAVDGFGANGKSQFDKVQAGSVTDLVRNIPGVTTSISANDPAQAVNIRGLQDFGRVNVLVDGARQNFQRSGHNANGSFYLDPEFISTIDVTRGPSANAYGSGAIGGVASFSTRGIDDVLGLDEKAAIVQKTGFGTNGAGYLTSTSAGLRVGPNVDLFGQFVDRNTTTFENGADERIKDSSFEDYGGLGKIAVRPFAGAEITGSALAQRYDFINGVGSSNQAPRRDTDVQADTYTLGYTFKSPTDPLIDFTSKVYHTKTVTEQKQVSPVTAVTRFRDFEIQTSGFDVFNTSRFATGVLGHRLTYGADGFEDRVNVEDLFSTADLFTPSGERRVWGSFVEDEVKVTSWLRVIGGLRYDAYELEGNGFSSDGEHVSPKGTISLTPLNGLEVYGSWAEGYRAPALTETLIDGGHPSGPFQPDLFTFVPNPGLSPEVGQNKEIGVNLKYDNVVRAGDRFRGKFNLFRNDVEDYIDGVVFGPPGPFVPFSFFQYQNIAKARVEGAEIELNYDWGAGFAILTGTRTRGTNRENGLALATIPPDRVSGTLAYRFLNGRLVTGARVHLVEASERNISQGADGFATIYRPTDTRCSTYSAPTSSTTGRRSILQSTTSRTCATRSTWTRKTARACRRARR